MPMSIERLTQILKAFGRARFGRRSEKLGSLTTGGRAARTDLTGGAMGNHRPYRDRKESPSGVGG
ncbi:hypothetical protein [Sinorhizobium medicae]